MHQDQLSLDVRLLHSLLRKSKDKATILHRICNRAPQLGLAEDVLSILFDLILSPPQVSNLTHTEKLFIIHNALVPRSAIILETIITRILSQINVPCIRHTNHKSRVVRPTVLLALLKFLSHSMHAFGEPGHRRFTRSLPILFKHLLVEYARPYIVELICTTFSREAHYYLNSARNLTDYQPTIFKKWYVRFTVDLYAKFPTDKSLYRVLILFKQSYPQSNVEDLMQGRGLCFSNPGSGFQSNQSRSSEVSDSSQRIEQTFSIKPAKPDISLTSHPDFEVLDSDLAQKLTSESSLLFEEEGNLTSSLLSQDDIIWPRSDSKDSTPRRVSASHNPEFSGRGDRPIRKIWPQDYHLYEFDSRPPQAWRDEGDSMVSYNFMQRCKLLPFFSNDRAADFCARFLEPTLSSIPSNSPPGRSNNILIPKLALSVIRLLAKWRNLSEIDNILFHKICSDALTTWWKHLALCRDQTVPFTCLLLLQFVKSLPRSGIDRHFSDLAILLPPLLVSRLALTGDPIIQSLICGHIAYGKDHRFESAALQTLHNTYVASLVNLYWSDRGLQSSFDPESPHQAFFFPRELISLLTALPTFSSGSETLNSMGGVFANLAWSAILAQLIRKLEDQSTQIAVRHYGPVTRESVLRISEDPLAPWLDMSFEMVKREVMKGFDRLGFTGFADLIFSSVRGLLGERERYFPVDDSES